MSKKQFLQKLEMKNNKILQVLKKYIAKQKNTIDSSNVKLIKTKTRSYV